MHCSVLGTNVSFFNSTSSDISLSEQIDETLDNKEGYYKYVYLQVRFYCYQVIIPIVFTFGIIGNGVSVTVLRRKRLRHSFDDVEENATCGLVCLALSDMAFCIIGLLTVFMPSNATSMIQDTSLRALVAIYYNNYKGPLLNIFLLTSTWLIVNISVARYLAITDPFKARITESVRTSYITKAIIFLFAILINIPPFLRYEISSVPCPVGCYCYFRKPGPLFHLTWYHVVWHGIGTLVPSIILIYCNCGLLRQIYRSLHGCPHRYSTSRITLILVSIITLFLLLVCPSMILTFISEVIPQRVYPFRIAVAITNLMQATNFAINFVLYSAISKQFRVTMISMVCERQHSKMESKSPRLHLMDQKDQAATQV